MSQPETEEEFLKRNGIRNGESPIKRQVFCEQYHIIQKNELAEKLGSHEYFCVLCGMVFVEVLGRRIIRE